MTPNNLIDKIYCEKKIKGGSVQKEINVCFSCDDNYSKYAGVVIASILSNAESDEFIHFFILDGNISQENKDKLLELKQIKNCEINFIQVKEEQFELYKQVNSHKYITIQTYYRLKIAELLPDISRVIYLDCDMLVQTSLSKLFDIDLGDNIIAGCLDARVLHKRKWKGKKYINAGMILFDLDKIRAEKIEDKFFEYTKDNIDSIKTGDQDIINFTLENRIKIIDNNWNVQVSGFASRTSYTNTPYIIHYIGNDKPWVFGSCTYFKDRYFDTLQLTPWKLSDDEKEYWYFKNKKVSRRNFWRKRSYCIISPKYWYAFFKSFT